MLRKRHIPKHIKRVMREHTLSDMDDLQHALRYVVSAKLYLIAPRLSSDMHQQVHYMSVDYITSPDPHAVTADLMKMRASHELCRKDRRVLTHVIDWMECLIQLSYQALYKQSLLEGKQTQALQNH